MKKSFLLCLFVVLMLVSCNKEKEIIDTLVQYNSEMETKGYHLGDKINFPKEVIDNAESITISFGDKETANLVIDPKFFTLGDNLVTINITKDGKVINQDATINVFAKSPEKNLTYQIVSEYPHDAKNFVQGFQLEGNTIYESDGQFGKSRLLKYSLGTINPIAENKQGDSIFSEGSAIVENKIYQLTWKNKKGFIYDKSSLKLIKEFDYPNVMGEGWGLTYDGKNLIASDGTKNLYFLEVNNPSKMVKFTSVAGNKEVYDQINELEYYKGFVYANIWQKPIIIKIDPKTGEVVGKFDFTALVKQNTKGEDDVLNGITFKGDNMLITGKYWNKIYEVRIE